jgi:hypothetical protein
MQPIDPEAPNDPISWRAIAKDMPVYAVGGELVGQVDELLGSDEEDVFHGIVLRPVLEGTRRVAVSSGDITAINRHGLVCSWTPQEILTLPEYTEERSYALGWKKAPFIYRYLPGQHPDRPAWIEEK